MIRILYILVGTALLGLTACETPTDNSIEEARQCSDKASQVALVNPSAATSQGAVCAAMLNGINTAESNQILFGDLLIEDGILGNIAQAAASETSKAGNVDALNSMLLVLVDTANPNHVTNTTGSSLTTVASGTNSSGMIYVANLISMATILYQLSTLTTSTPPQNVPASITACTGTCASELQTSFNAMSTAACSSSGTGNSTLCTKATAISALAGPNPTPAQLVSALATYAGTAH